MPAWTRSPSGRISSSYVALGFGRPSRPRRWPGAAAGPACSTVGCRRGAAPTCRCAQEITLDVRVLAFTAAGCALTAFGLVAGYTVRRARLPLREGRKRLPVDRQVQLIAGLMVVTGVGLGLAVSPWFLAVAAFFGAGLVFAGATGTCGLAFVLMKMPWNATPPLPTEGGGAMCAAGDGQAPTCAAAPRTQD